MPYRLGAFQWCKAISESLRVINDVGVYMILSVTFLSWLATIIYAIKMIRRARAGVAIWGRATLWNPFNLLLMPGLLTNAGRSYRRKCFLAVAVFVGTIGAAFALGSITGSV